jgi:hypothetical protein
LEKQLPGLPQPGPELPRPYQRTMRNLVKALKETIESEAAGAKEFEVSNARLRGGGGGGGGGPPPPPPPPPPPSARPQKNNSSCLACPSLVIAQALSADHVQPGESTVRHKRARAKEYEVDNTPPLPLLPLLNHLPFWSQRARSNPPPPP